MYLCSIEQKVLYIAFDISNVEISALSIVQLDLLLRIALHRMLRCFYLVFVGQHLSSLNICATTQNTCPAATSFKHAKLDSQATHCTTCDIRA